MQDGRSSRHTFDAGGIYLRDFAEDYKADLSGAFDFVLMELSPAVFQRLLADRRGPFSGLRPVAGERDEVLHQLARTVAAAMARPQETSPLFLDQMGLAIAAHLAHRYAGAAPVHRRARAGLSRAQEARAKEMLRARLDGTVSIAEIAAACQVSEGHFIRAFRQTTGKSPLQWLLAERLNTARGLLLDSRLPLAEIAHTCGFADQSHFTRVFARFEGRPPGSWRREARSC
jgi:transcriptional regulator GlxA family with amidase domain